jgi:hypothetical protein
MSYDERWEKERAALEARSRELAYQREREARERAAREAYQREQERQQREARAKAEAAYLEKQLKDSRERQTQQQKDLLVAQLRNQKIFFEAFDEARKKGMQSSTPSHNSGAAWQGQARMGTESRVGSRGRGDGEASRWATRWFARLLMLPFAVGAFAGIGAGCALIANESRTHAPPGPPLVLGLVCLLITRALSKVVQRNR